jgi:bifunctional UDP-N-acetylglucosamine pyrophosphorylase/glucosamine-1-phosphate N-acetyltransferase
LAGPIVVILAAGQGTRMNSRVPKLLHPLCGRPMIGWPVAAARASGASRIVVVDAPGEPLREHLDEDVVSVVQERARGTADAVLAARPHFAPDAPVIVLAGDMPLITAETLLELMQAHTDARAAATVLSAIVEDPSGYGRVVRLPDGGVERIVETKEPGDATPEQLEINEISTGTFVFAGGTLAAALEQVGTDNAQGEYYLPDVLQILGRQGHTVAGHVTADPLQTLGVNDHRQLAEVRAVAQRRITDTHMLAGVTIVDPATTVIDVDVTIEPDAVIAPFTCLHGLTAIGSGSTVGPHATLMDSQIGAGTTILHSVIRESVVEDNVSIGPFASLRPGTVLRDRSKAGTFVELKNSDVGVGSKVPHLSYIGDTDIGEDTNLGASTITANYDGYRKHRTTIGSRVKTSVDTTLVAPVTVGDDAYTGAGSVITDDVPDGALGMARARQQNIDGYAERRRERMEAERSKHD